MSHVAAPTSAVSPGFRSVNPILVHWLGPNPHLHFEEGGGHDGGSLRPVFQPDADSWVFPKHHIAS